MVRQQEQCGLSTREYQPHRKHEPYVWTSTARKRGCPNELRRATPAAAFDTDCSLLVTDFGAPTKTTLQ